MKPLSIEWTKTEKTEAARKELEKTIRASSTTLLRLKEILEEQLASIEAEETKSAVYEKASWPFYQAHLNGEKNRLKRIIQLLSFLN